MNLRISCIGGSVGKAVARQQAGWKSLTQTAIQPQPSKRHPLSTACLCIALYSTLPDTLAILEWTNFDQTHICIAVQMPSWPVAACHHCLQRAFPISRSSGDLLRAWQSKMVCLFHLRYLPSPELKITKCLRSPLQQLLAYKRVVIPRH